MKSKGCVICKKPTKSINPMKAFRVDRGIVCTPECFQKDLDEVGLKIYDNDRKYVQVPPGAAKLSLTRGFEACNGFDVEIKMEVIQFMKG